MMWVMARAATTADVFNAVAEARRRQILDVLAAGEKAVSALAEVLPISQPEVSKHLKVLSKVGLVESRSDGRQRLYRINGQGLKAIHDWVSAYEQHWHERLDRLDTYLNKLSDKEESNDHIS
jgi:DNA-binding transcriptional ArsR family regulator